jgi:hypothetical protein
VTPPSSPKIGGLVAIAMLGYLAAARGVGNLYPFSTFEMYGATRLVDASRIVVRERDEVHELDRFSQWRCDSAPDPDPRVCVACWTFFNI